MNILSDIRRPGREPPFFSSILRNASFAKHNLLYTATLNIFSTIGSMVIPL